MDLTDVLKINKKKVIPSKFILNEIQKNKNLEFNLPLGLKYFDKTILKGGVHPNKKYLIYGANKTGKTQLCHQICVQAFKFLSKNSKNSKKNPIKIILYLDTENTFRPERIKEIASERNLDYIKIFKTINVSKIMSNSALLLKLKEIEEQKQPEKLRVLIIDSINNHYRSEQGISFYNAKMTFLKSLKIINQLTKKFNLITFATAQIVPNFIDDAIVRDIPVGNQYLNHFFSEYFYLGIEEDKNYIHILNSQLFPEKKVFFKISSKGIEEFDV